MSRPFLLISEARGEFLVIFDAEDRPEPDQLKKALDLSRKSGGKETEARSLNTIGEAYFGLGEYTKALDYHPPHDPLAPEVDQRVANVTVMAPSFVLAQWTIEHHPAARQGDSSGAQNHQPGQNIAGAPVAEEGHQFPGNLLHREGGIQISR